MTTIQFSEGSQPVRGWVSSEDFTVSLVDASEPYGIDGDIQHVIADITYDGHTTAGALKKSDLVVFNNLDNPPVSFESKTPNICTVDSAGKVHWVSNGVCRIGVRGQCGERIIAQNTNTTGAYTFYDSISSYAEGSLRKYLRDQQIAALVDVVPGAASQRAGLYPNGWAAGLTDNVYMAGSYGGVNPNNFIRAQGKAGFAGFNDLVLLDELLDNSSGGAGWKVWLSPHHYLSWLGHTTSPMGGSNWKRALNPSNGLPSEVTLFYSATPSPASSVAKLFPVNIREYLPNTPWPHTAISLWARMYNNYQGGGITSEKRWVQPVSYGGEALFNRTTGGDPRRVYQYTNAQGLYITGGDSGTPVFASVNGDLVFVSHITQSENAGFGHYSDFIAQLNEFMAYFNASGTYTVQTVDLSGFTNYS